MSAKQGSVVLARFMAERNAQRMAEKPAAQGPRRARLYSLQKAARGYFQAGGTDRLTSDWTTVPLNADQIIERNYRVLVARSRQQVNNNDYARAFLRMNRQNIVGPQGVTLQAKARNSSGKLDKKANEELERGFLEWCKPQNCDITGRQSLRSLKNSAINSCGSDGEFFFRIVTGRDAGPWGFALQIIDPMRCPVDLSDERPADGGFIRQGIHFNLYGRPVWYYFTATDAAQADYFFGGRHCIRVPASEIIHGFRPDIVGQKRGLPWMATGLFRMRHLNGMEDAAVVNARVGASKMGFIEWDENTGPEPDEEDDLEIDGEAGSFPVLPSGARLKEWSPQYPNGEFAPFYKTMLRGIAAGMGVAYNNLANDLEGVNFSSIRQGALDEREHYKEMQQWLIETLIQPIFDAWLPRALLSGNLKLDPTKLDRYRSITWQPRRWQWIDPRADVDGAVATKNNMLDSPGHIIREQGRDPSTVWTESAADVREMIDAYTGQGISKEVAEELVLLHMGKAPKKPEPEKKAEK